MKTFPYYHPSLEKRSLIIIRPSSKLQLFINTHTSRIETHILLNNKGMVDCNNGDDDDFWIVSWIKMNMKFNYHSIDLNSIQINTTVQPSTIQPSNRPSKHIKRSRKRSNIPLIRIRFSIKYNFISFYYTRRRRRPFI